jgi:small subunit ribosomal protein S19
MYVKNSNFKETSVNNIISRRTSIIPELIGKTVKIHNGKNFKEILVTKEMINHKVGEFFKTRVDFEFKKKKKKKK